MGNGTFNKVNWRGKCWEFSVNRISKIVHFLFFSSNVGLNRKGVNSQ